MVSNLVMKQTRRCLRLGKWQFCAEMATLQECDMGKRQDVLKNILQQAGYTIANGRLPSPNKEILEASVVAGEVWRIYRDLGGVSSEILPLNLGKWDIEVDGIAVELDEDLHFNRYRSLTLQSPLYDKLPHFPLEQFRNYCKHYESACVRAGSYGRKWTNNSCEKQYGKAETAGKLTGNGAPRWKQRAFYDFVKDMTPFLLNISVVRISIWDSLRINGAEYLVEEILDKEISSTTKQFSELIQTRQGR